MIKLKVKDVNLSTGGPLIAILNKNDAQKYGLRALDRILLRRLKNKQKIISAIDISDKGIKEGQIGLFSETLHHLRMPPDGTKIEVEETPRPKSVDYIRKKLDGGSLTKQELKELVQDIFANVLSEVELTYFTSACYAHPLSTNEIVYLTEAILETGNKLKINHNPVLDKHCIGGVAGNRETMIVVPIIAALGFKIPKTSSRSITSAAGTSDTMEVLAPVLISREKIKECIRKTNGCMIWESSLNPYGADERIIKVRHPVSIDPKGLMLASVLAKKKMVGATHVIIDIPYGEGAKIKTKALANKLKKDFIKVGKRIDIKVKVVLTDGNQPIGNGIGPALEARDVMSVLMGGGPNDLRNKSVMIATELLEMVKVKDANQKVLTVLNSGLAYKKMLEIIKYQGGSTNIKIPYASYFQTIKSPKNGEITFISNKQINKLARMAGAPQDKAAGIYLSVHTGYQVKKNDVLYTVYAESKEKLNFTYKYAKKESGIIIK